jgi:nicotine blue oxidoreductase
VDEVVVVEGAHPLGELGGGARLVACGEWADGPGASLRCGLAALRADAEAAVVVLADGPGLDPRAVDRVVAAWRGGAGDLLAASYDGTRDHPLLVARTLWGDVPDEGLRAREPVLVACDDLRPPGDVDRPEDLR